MVDTWLETEGSPKAASETEEARVRDQEHSYSGLLRQTFNLFFTRLRLFAGVAAVPALVNVVCVVALLSLVQIVTVRAGIENQPLDVPRAVGFLHETYREGRRYSRRVFKHVHLRVVSSRRGNGSFKVQLGRRNEFRSGLSKCPNERAPTPCPYMGSRVCAVIGWMLAVACIPGVPAAVLENRGVVGALQEAATSGHYARRLLVWLLCLISVIPVLGLTVLVFAPIAGALPSLVSRAAAAVVFVWIIALVALPQTIALTLSYLGSRVQTAQS